LLRDTERARAYDDAISRRVKKLVKKKAKLNLAEKGTSNSSTKKHVVSVLDIGAGSGLLSMMAARAGADKVVAAEWHGDLATAARRNIAANGLSNKVTVASGDVAKLQRGKQGVPIDGFDVAVVDLFDAGFTGDHALWMLEQARKNVLGTDAAVIPAAATMYVMGIEQYTAEVGGFDFSAFNKYRWCVLCFTNPTTVLPLMLVNVVHTSRYTRLTSSFSISQGQLVPRDALVGRKAPRVNKAETGFRVLFTGETGQTLGTAER
jgi:protein arginine N-methyltransferase 7